MQAKRLRRHDGKTAASAVKHKLILRPSEVGLLLGDAMKAKEELGWQPTTSLQKLFKITAKKWWPLAKLEHLVTSQKAA
jgi:GDP-D-mannose dehydratase